RLLRYRHVGEHPDPYAAGALHVARHGAPGGLDLPRRDALRLQGLEPVLAEIERGPRRGGPVDPPLMGLAELGPAGLQHGCALVVLLLRGVPPRASDLAFGEPLVLRHRIVLDDLALEYPHLHAP